MVSAPIVQTLIREQIKNRQQRDWHLSNPHLWADEHLGLELYRRHVVEGGKWLGWHPAQIAFLRDVCNWKVPKVFAICCRGWGKTWLTAVAISLLIFYNPRLKINVFSGSKDQARNCYNYMKDMINHCPILQGKVDGKPLMSETRFLAGGWIKIIAAAGTQTKGGRANINIVDEVCETDSTLLQTLFGTTITAILEKTVFLTTPDKLGHICKEWWDEYQKLKIIRYQFTAYDTKHITKARIDELRDFLTDAQFRIMVLAQWTSSTGNPFNYADIQAAKCDMADLPPVHEIDRFFMGIDWGYAHEAVASVWGIKGDPADNTDQWYLYAVESWRQQTDDVILDGIFWLCEMYTPLILSENAPISKFANIKLRANLPPGISMRTETFTKKKHQVINNFKARLEKGKVHIPRTFRKTTEQLTEYHFKERAGQITEEYAKVKDDYVDAAVWAHWGIHLRMNKVEHLGDYDH